MVLNVENQASVDNNTNLEKKSAEHEISVSSTVDIKAYYEVALEQLKTECDVSSSITINFCVIKGFRLFWF